LYALERYGTLDRAVVLEPAIRAAEQGIVADESWVENAEELAKRLGKHPALKPLAASIVRDLCLDGTVAVGDRVRNPQQARALRLIADDGRDAFYTGPIADAIVAVMENEDGPLTRADLAGYRVRVSEPLRGRFRGLEVLAMPPPSSGGIAVLQILGMVDRRLDDAPPPRPAGTAYVHLVAEAMKHAFADRATWLADAAFVDVPVDRLLDGAYLDERAASITDRTHALQHYGSRAPVADDGGTSHYSIVDGQGMAVACSQTINLEYGSLVEVPGFGFMLNDEMDDFTTIPGQANAFGLQQSDRNLPEPGKRPLSSMSPTIVRHGDGRPLLIVGASGGPRIISGTLQCVLNCLVFGMSPRDAVAMPRFHHQWQPDVLYFEERWTDDVTVEGVRRMGHEPGRRRGVGVVQLITVHGDGVRAASDPRKGGAPDGI
jgi:gamma-glutamyltranspeptidase/glutathione hydrolase